MLKPRTRTVLGVWRVLRSQRVLKPHVLLFPGNGDVVLNKTLKAVIKKAKARSGSNLGHAGIFSRGSVTTGGPTASRACENWRIPRAGAPPNPDEASGSVPVPGGVGCFRAEKLQEFLFVIFLFLK